MTGIAWAFDVVVVLLLLGLAGRIMLTRDLFQATVLFIAFGLTLSLAWVRLGAADVALAEAALGAGVTGALLLNALRRLTGGGESDGDAGGEPVVDWGRHDRPGTFGSRWIRWGMMGGLAVFAAGLGTVLLSLTPRPPILPGAVAGRMGETGVSNPVTAVLLGFRAYDTFLEMGVLVVAMVAVWSLDRGSRAFARAPGEGPGETPGDPVLEAWARLVVPVAGVTAVYLVWAGSTGAGGAFQGGALLAGAGVLVVSAGIVRPVRSAAPIVRILGTLGLVLFTVVGLVPMPWTGAFLAYPQGAAYGLTLLVEAALTISIAVILWELFLDVPAVLEADPSLEQVDPTGDPLGRAVGPDGALIRSAWEDE